MTLIIVVFNEFSGAGAITLIFTMASYTYGPLLGLFIFGLFSQREPRGWSIPLLAVAAPTLSYIIARNSAQWFAGYQFSYEILVVNAIIMLLGLTLLSRPQAE
jgi:hypothetical protein